MEDTITIQNKEIVMYAGTLVAMGSAIKGVEGLEKIMYDTELQSKVVSVILYDKKTGKHIIDPDMLRASEFEDLLAWGVEHYSNFILRSSEKMAPKLQSLAQDITTIANNLNHTNNG